jgi:hypothetical protein
MFRDYAHRGSAFKEEVRRLAAGAGETGEASKADSGAGGPGSGRPCG